MALSGSLRTFPKELKWLIGAFIVVLSIGFYTGLLFVNETTHAKPAGIEEQYLGNEDQEEVAVMKFKKSDKEMLTLVHNHMLSLSVIFFLLGLILYTTKLPKKLKSVLMVEPIASVVCTFGGIYFLWKGVLWMKYIVMLSGALMTLSYTLAVAIILFQLVQKPKPNIGED
ncbi:MAG: hypothetical protein GYB39_08305 [Algicola sp.]|nr:hypothetical protein [Algicola sp.]